MPFVLVPAPFVIAKLIDYPLLVLRERVIQSLANLDDWILWSSSQASARQDCQQARSVLKSLRFQVNLDKLVLTPRQRLKWLEICNTKEGVCAP